MLHQLRIKARFFLLPLVSIDSKFTCRSSCEPWEYWLRSECVHMYVVYPVISSIGWDQPNHSLILSVHSTILFPLHMFIYNYSNIIVFHYYSIQLQIKCVIHIKNWIVSIFLISQFFIIKLWANSVMLLKFLGIRIEFISESIVFRVNSITGVLFKNIWRTTSTIMYRHSNQSSPFFIQLQHIVRPNYS